MQIRNEERTKQRAIHNKVPIITTQAVYQKQQPSRTLSPSVEIKRKLPLSNMSFETTEKLGSLDTTELCKRQSFQSYPKHS